MGVELDNTEAARRTSHAPHPGYLAAATACLGLGLAVWGARQTPGAALAPVLAFALSYGLVVQSSVTLPSGLRFSSAAVVLAAAGMAIGPPAIWIVIPGYAVRFLRNRDLSWRLPYTCGQIAISFTAAIEAVSLLGGRFGHLGGAVDSLRALAFIVTYDVVNGAFAAVRGALDQGGAWRSIFGRLVLGERGISQLLYYVLAVVSAQLWSGYRWVGLTLITALALFLHASLIQAAESARRYEEAHTDSLTGLGNRRRLGEWDRNRPAGPFGLLFIDLDRLKTFNDRYGHAAGDAALVATAQVLREQTRSSDLLIRYGGDEFVAILPGKSALEAELAAERIVDALGERTLMVGRESTVLQASVGAAACPEHGEALEDLLRHADAAMYGRKRRAAPVS
jgi:diguanylate cyclase (GGDEF)-like protein